MYSGPEAISEDAVVLHRRRPAGVADLDRGAGRQGRGFGHLELEQQRSRLRDLLKKLSNRVKVPTILVWDGGEVQPSSLPSEIEQSVPNRFEQQVPTLPRPAFDALSDRARRLLRFARIEG